MKISTRSLYGARMMVHLAEHYGRGPVRLSDIADREDMPVAFLRQLANTLKQANLLRPFRGRKGGYVLARSPRKISVGDIFRTLENGLDLASCIADPKGCGKFRDCPTRAVLVSATQAMQKEFDSTPLFELVENGKKGKRFSTKGQAGPKRNDRQVGRPKGSRCKGKA